MKQIFTILFVILISLPSIGSPTREKRSTPARKSRIERSSLYNIHASHHNRPMARNVKNTSVIKQELDSIIYQEYAMDLNDWYDYSKTDYTYDAFGRNTLSVESYYYSETGTYVPDTKWAYSYNNNNLVEILVSYYNSDISEWGLVYKYAYTYNPDNTISTEMIYIWNLVVWDPIEKTENTYNASGKLTTELNYYWYEDSSEWIVSGKTEYGYNVDGSIAVITEFMWIDGARAWIGTYKEEFTYNVNGQLSIENYFSWDDTGNLWLNDYRDEYTYDGNQNVTMVIGDELIENEWQPEYKNEFTYNNAFGFEDLLLPYDFQNETGIFNHMITLVLEYEWDGSTFVQVDRSIARYSEVNITGVAVNPVESARIYPQPANGSITFTWESSQSALDLNVYDVNGKKVMDAMVRKNVPFQTGQLAPGLYFYRLTSDRQTVYSGKLSIW